MTMKLILTYFVLQFEAVTFVLFTLLEKLSMFFSLQNKTLLVVANTYDRFCQTISLHGGSTGSFILCHVCGVVALGLTPPAVLAGYLPGKCCLSVSNDDSTGQTRSPQSSTGGCLLAKF